MIGELTVRLVGPAGGSEVEIFPGLHVASVALNADASEAGDTDWRPWGEVPEQHRKAAEDYWKAVQEATKQFLTSIM